jgi:hypothetical protein
MALPTPPPEVPIDTSLDALAPKFRAKVEELLTQLTAKGWDPVVAESVRSNARQQYLYGFGRQYDDDRGIVTNSQDGDETWHHFGLAVDIISKSKQWDAPPRFWNDLGATAIALGLSWGGLWVSFADRPHVQHGPPMRQSPSPRAARLLADGGMEAVWKEVQAI